MEWISVKDRLPDIEKESYPTKKFFLVSSNQEFSFVAIAEFDHGHWECLLDWMFPFSAGYDGYAIRVNKGEITHWMPLPDQPK